MSILLLCFASLTLRHCAYGRILKGISHHVEVLLLLITHRLRLREWWIVYVILMHSAALLLVISL